MGHLLSKGFAPLEHGIMLIAVRTMTTLVNSESLNYHLAVHLFNAPSMHQAPRQALSMKWVQHRHVMSLVGVSVDREEHRQYCYSGSFCPAPISPPRVL